MDSKHMDVWQVEFSYAGKCYYSFLGPCENVLSNHVPGDCLISSGDDGVIRFWKMSLAGEWLEYAETDMS